jgi:hypothetical protein
MASLDSGYARSRALPLTGFSHWRYQRLKPNSEKPRERGYEQMRLTPIRPDPP